VKERYVNASESGPIASAQNRGTFRKSVRRRRRKTPPNGERAPSGMRRTPSKSLVPTDRDGSQELSRLLFYCFSSRWHFDFSHRDRTTCTPRAVGCTSNVEAPQTCRPGFWFMTTPAVNTSSGRLFHTVFA